MKNSTPPPPKGTIPPNHAISPIVWQWTLHRYSGEDMKRSMSADGRFRMRGTTDRSIKLFEDDAKIIRLNTLAITSPMEIS